MKNLELNGFGTDIAYLEAKGLSKCFEAYAENTEVEDNWEEFRKLNSDPDL